MKFRAGKEPSLNLILNLIEKCSASDWWPEKSCSIWWARELRFEFRENAIKKTNMWTRTAQKFLDYISWLETYFETHTELSFDLAKGKHIELIGPIKHGRAWGKFSLKPKKQISKLIRHVLPT